MRGGDGMAKTNTKEKILYTKGWIDGCRWMSKSILVLAKSSNNDNDKLSNVINFCDNSEKIASEENAEHND